MTETDEFVATLVGTELVLKMKTHHATAASAKAAVADFVRSWEILIGLNTGGGNPVRFEHEETEILDRDPPPDGLSLQTKLVGRAYASGTIRVEQHIKPEQLIPSSQFAVSPDVETLYNRYVQYLKGREPLIAIHGNFCFTVVRRDWRASNEEA